MLYRKRLRRVWITPSPGGPRILPGCSAPSPKLMRCSTPPQGKSPLAVVVDRGDVQGAIETPSGEMREPRLRRSVADSGTACEVWLKGLIPEFQPLGADLLESAAAPESALDPHLLARKVVGEVSTAGARARIQAKQETWRDFGDLEVERLVDLVQEAQLGQLSEEDYKSRIDELVVMAA